MFTLTRTNPDNHWIVLEGPGGSGKSTSLQFLAELLRKKFPKHSIVHTKEPTGTKYGRRARDEELPKEDSTGLFVLDRLQHIGEVVVPRLNKPEPKIIIQDRYWQSTAVYQSEDLIEMALIASMHTTLLPQPDLLVLLDASPEVLHARISARRRDLQWDVVGVQECRERRMRYNRLNTFFQRRMAKNVFSVNTDGSLVQVQTCLSQYFEDLSWM